LAFEQINTSIKNTRNKPYKCYHNLQFAIMGVTTIYNSMGWDSMGCTSAFSVLIDVVDGAPYKCYRNLQFAIKDGMHMVILAC
jgi:hypothetical protein